MNRNRDLFWNLVESEHLEARAFCRKLAGNRDEGDDLYQDSLVRALTGFENLRKIEAFRAWFYRVVINTYRNRFRQPWWKKLVPMTEEIATNYSGSDPDTVYVARRRLDRAFQALSTNDRALVILYEMQGWSITDLAAMSGQTEGNLRVRLSRARQKMRNVLIKHLTRTNPVKNQKTLRSEDQICTAMKSGEK